jgi:hypothetical protein
MQDKDFEIIEKDAALLPGEARILRRMADLIKQRGLDSLFTFLQPSLLQQAAPIVPGQIVPAAPTATIQLLKKLLVEWLNKVQKKMYSDSDIKINLNTSSPVTATVICVECQKGK